MSMRKLISLMLVCLLAMTSIVPLAGAEEALSTPTDIVAETPEEAPDEEPTEVAPAIPETEENDDDEEEEEEVVEFVIEGAVLVAYQGEDTHVVIPDSVKAIGARAFYGNETIESVDLNRVMEVRAEAFAGCTSLSRVIFSQARLARIGSKAFAYCEELEPLVLRDNAQIADDAFLGCKLPGAEDEEEEIEEEPIDEPQQTEPEEETEPEQPADVENPAEDAGDETDSGSDSDAQAPETEPVEPDADEGDQEQTEVGGETDSESAGDQPDAAETETAPEGEASESEEEESEIAPDPEIEEAEGAGIVFEGSPSFAKYQTSVFEITEQPEDAYSPLGGKVTFSVASNASGATYKWMVSKNGEVWYSTTLTGYDTRMLTVPVTASRDGYSYRCVVTDTNGETAVSDAAMLHITQLSFSKQPQPVSVYAGSMASFTVQVIGDDLTYQWKYSKDHGTTWSNSPLTSATTDTLKVPATLNRNGYMYKCVVTSSGANIHSEGALLTVLEGTPPKISAQPKDTTTYVGTKVNMKVTASGEELTYLWKISSDGGKSWRSTTLTGYTTDTLVIPATITRDGFMYKCIITDKNGIVIESDAATLRVVDGVTIEITQQPQDTQAALGCKATITVEAEGEGLTYLWKYSSNGGTSWYGTTLEGYKTNALTVPATASRNGYMYKCIITDALGCKVDSEPALFTVVEAKPLEILKQPENAIAELGTKATFTVEVSGDGLTYLWQCSSNGGASWYGSTAEGYKTNTLTIPVTESRNGYLYRCNVTDVTGAKLQSDSAKLIIASNMTELEITQQPQDTEVNINEDATFNVTANGDDLTYVWQSSEDGLTWSDLDLENQGATLTLTATLDMDGLQYRCVVTDCYDSTVTTVAATLTVNNLLLVNEVEYAYTDSGLTVVSYRGSATSVTIPATVNGTAVTAIGESAFEGNKTLESIDLPDSITVIGRRAFANCSSLSSMQ